MEVSWNTQPCHLHNKSLRRAVMPRPQTRVFGGQGLDTHAWDVQKRQPISDFSRVRSSFRAVK
jgi:hypothetical protein